MKYYFDKLKFNLFIKYIEKFNDSQLIIDYVDNNKLSNEQIYILAVLLCKTDDPTVILEFVTKQHVSDKNCLNMLGNAIYKSDNLYCMHNFATYFLGLPINNKIINRMCELKDTGHLLPYLKSEFISLETKRNIVATITESGSYEQIDKMVRDYYLFLTDEERNDITDKVCTTLNGKLICNVSSYFKNNEKTQFVEAICMTKCAQKKYLFLEKNNDLEEWQKMQVVLSICASNEIEYIYKTLILLKEEATAIRIVLLDKIKKIGDPKYLLLATIYCNEDYVVRNFERIEMLYSKSIISEDINEVFTNEELMNMYKHMQKIKSENKQLIKQKRDK